MRARMSAEAAFRLLADGMSKAASSDEFFATMVMQLAKILDVDHVLVARVDALRRVHTLAVWSDGALRDNLSYDLAGSPCETVSGLEVCLYPDAIQQRFPEDLLLKQMGAESYLGIPLFSTDGRSLGLLAVLHNSPMQPTGLESEVLYIAAAQAGAQIERSQATQALLQSEAMTRESERRLDTLLNQLPGMAYRSLNDADWTMLVVSQGAKALTGYSPEALLHNVEVSYAELIHPLDCGKVRAAVDDAVSKGAPFRIVYRLRTADGQWRWMLEQGQAIFGSDGQARVLEGFISDITEQHEVQRVQEAVARVATAVTTRIGDGYFHHLVQHLVEILEADAGFLATFPSGSRSSNFWSSNAQLSSTGSSSTGSSSTWSSSTWSSSTWSSSTWSSNNGAVSEEVASPWRYLSTTSVVAEGRRQDNHTFDLSASPFFALLTAQGQECMGRLGEPLGWPGFANDYRAWIGRRLDNTRGEPVGVVVVLYREPPETNDFVTSVLRILSNGAAAEVERRQNHRRMRQLAYLDGTTGLANRARFMEELVVMHKAAKHQQKPLGLLLLDIRRFKEINDLHGPQMGDQLLAAVAERLQSSLVQGEVLARLSGDEFALLVPQATAVQVERCIVRMRGTIARTIYLEHHGFSLKVSVGMAVYPSDAETPGELFKAAGIALYHAKREEEGVGRFNASMRSELERRQQMTERLGRAIRENRLVLHYQPQVNLHSGRLAGAEALCRWHDAQWGWVSPGEFIPLAEERGLIRPLGDRVLEQATQQLLSWGAQGLTLSGRLSLNISAQQFADPQLAERITRLTRGLSASSIALELTESDFMRDPEKAVVITHLLREAGFTLAIDDFGTGYSSLAYLRRFSAQALKIDMSFVRHMLENQHDRTIVDTIIAMAQALGMKTVAEGVETAAQAEALAEMGCDVAQGYYFGRPLAAEEFVAQWLGAKPGDAEGLFE